MAILYDDGRVVFAEAVKNLTFHLAWGSGSPDWDVEPSTPATTDKVLVHEIGRRAATVVQYVKPDPSGSIVVPSGRFLPSATPTHYVHLLFQFTLADSPTAVIRECAIFANGVISSSVPSGQTYFLPADVQSPGRIVLGERFAAMHLISDYRRNFEFVISL